MAHPSTPGRAAGRSAAGAAAALAAGAALILTGGPAPAATQFAEFLGPHEIETLHFRGEVPGTGRIGGMTMDGFGYLYVANQDEGVWKIHPSGEVELFVTGLYGSGGNAMLPNGHLLQADYNGDRIIRVERDGTVHPFAEEGLDGPVGIAVAPDGVVYTVNYDGGYVSRIDPDGTVSELVRDDRLDGPNGIVSDPEGNLYVVNLGNTLVLRITPEAEVSVVATLPGSANAHVTLVGDALYVTQIWDHVVLRVEMDGSYRVVAGDGTMGFEDGPEGRSRVTYPNGITSRGQRIYFNTLRGNMVAGHVGSIEVQRLHAPSPLRVFEKAWKHGGMEAIRSRFEAARSLEEAPFERLAAALYQVGDALVVRGMTDAGLALTSWTAEEDPDEGRAHRELGAAYAIHGAKADALTHYEKALALDPDDEELQLRLEAVRTYRR